jgi:hypothetical protein
MRKSLKLRDPGRSRAVHPARRGAGTDPMKRNVRQKKNLVYIHMWPKALCAEMNPSLSIIFSFLLVFLEYY